MCQLYVKYSYKNVNTAIKIEFSAGEEAVTFGRWHLLSDFFLHLDKERLLS